ncbi:MAG: alpha-isopropylmalate synthase regulatory domain-containing protein, partial [Vicinamibacterales bacterium]
AERGGADVVVLCDTNGGCIPSEIVAITREARGRVEAQLGIHTHDDIGLGVANALASLGEGVTHVQGTFNGYGERVGNCNLTTLIPNLAFKLGHQSVPAESLPQLRDFSQFLDEVTNLRPNPRLPWVGSAAFSHKGGTHVNAVQKLLRSYEHVDPALVGNRRHVLISELAGRSSILMKAAELGLDVTKDTPQLSDMLERIKVLEHQGYEFEAADGSLSLLILEALQRRPRPFEVDGYHVSMRSDRQYAVCEATVKVRAGQQRAHTVAEGDGPVNALDCALRSALVKVYPHLQSVRLTDYKVRIVNPSTGTGARTRVLIETADEHSSWTTVGVHDNIIEASLQALIDSFEYGLIRRDAPVASR